MVDADTKDWRGIHSVWCPILHTGCLFPLFCKAAGHGECFVCYGGCNDYWSTENTCLLHKATETQRVHLLCTRAPFDLYETLFLGLSLGNGRDPWPFWRVLPNFGAVYA